MGPPSVPNALLLNKSKPADDVIPALSAETEALRVRADSV